MISHQNHTDIETKIHRRVLLCKTDTKESDDGCSTSGVATVGGNRQLHRQHIRSPFVQHNIMLCEEYDILLDHTEFLLLGTNSYCAQNQERLSKTQLHWGHCGQQSWY